MSHGYGPNNKCHRLFDRPLIFWMTTTLLLYLVCWHSLINSNFVCWSNRCFLFNNKAVCFPHYYRKVQNTSKFTDARCKHNSSIDLGLLNTKKYFDKEDMSVVRIFSFTFSNLWISSSVFFFNQNTTIKVNTII